MRLGCTRTLLLRHLLLLRIVRSRCCLWMPRDTRVLLVRMRLIVRWSRSMLLLLLLAMMILRMSVISCHQRNLYGVLRTGRRVRGAVCLLLLSMLWLGVRMNVTLRTSMSSYRWSMSRCMCAVLSWLDDLLHGPMLNDLWL